MIEDNNITNYSAFGFRSQALEMIEFLMDCVDEMEDDIGNGKAKH